LSVLWRMGLAVLGTWAVLLGVFLLPGPFLSASMQPVVYSHATVALWMLAMVVAPIVVLVGKREWIRTGRWRKGA
jgi:hypothetical protein